MTTIRSERKTASSMSCVTISIGIAGTDMRGKSFEQINREADVALYEAKRSGRNRVVTYEPADDARSG